MKEGESVPKTSGWQIVELAARLLIAEIDLPLIDSLFIAQGDLVGETGDLPFVLLDRALIALRREAALDELAAEYARLFVGPNPVCPPYASAHSGSVLVGGRLARAVDDVMAEHDLALPAQWRVVASDHLAVQLSVFEALDAGGRRGEFKRDSPAEFFRRFVQPWAAGYLRRVAAAARWAPYRTIPAAAAQVLDSWATQPEPVLNLHS